MKEKQDYQIVLYFKNDYKLSLYKFDLLQKKYENVKMKVTYFNKKIFKR